MLLAGLLLTSVFTMNAGILTVSNDPVVPAQFAAVQDAIDAAYPGDTILIAGSDVSYGVFNINKRLTLIGTGYAAVNQLHTVTKAVNVSLVAEEDNFGTVVNSASNSKIIGIVATAITFSQSVSITDITISECLIEGYIYMSSEATNVLIENNLIGGYINFGTARNVVVRNNLFNEGVDVTLKDSDKPSVLVVNNTFLGSGSTALFYQFSRGIFNNNIVYGFQPQGAETVTFNNNISFSAGDNAFLYGTNTGGNNLEATDPEFRVPGDLQGNLSPDKDYSLSSGSPALNAGTDGTDVGMTGGSMPFDVAGSSVSPIPVIYRMDILNATLSVDDTLKIRLKSSISN